MKTVATVLYDFLHYVRIQLSIHLIHENIVFHSYSSDLKHYKILCYINIMVLKLKGFQCNSSISICRLYPLHNHDFSHFKDKVEDFNLSNVYILSFSKTKTCLISVRVVAD